MATGPKHPATTMWLLTKVFLFLAIVFSIIAIWLPQWSRIKGNAIPTQNLKWVNSAVITPDSRLYMGLWRWCLAYADVDNVETCADWDAEGSHYPPGFGDPKCRGYTYATRILGLIGFGLCVIALILCVLVFLALGKWAKVSPWKAPMAIAALAVLLILLAFGCLLASWICWIVVAEHGCRNTASRWWDPFQGYSTSFILMCFASAFAFLALLTACLGLLKIKKTPALMYPEQPVYEEVMYPTVPVETMYAAPQYPSMPMSYAAEPYAMAPMNYAPAPMATSYPIDGGYGAYGAPAYY